MQLTLRELKEIERSLDKLLGADLPINISYRFTRVTKQIQSELKHFQESFQKLVKKYGETKQEKTLVPTEKVEEFNAEVDKLMKEEIAIDFTPICIDDLGDIKLSAIDLVNLDGKLIVDGNSREELKVIPGGKKREE